MQINNFSEKSANKQLKFSYYGGQSSIARSPNKFDQLLQRMTRKKQMMPDKEQENIQRKDKNKIEIQILQNSLMNQQNLENCLKSITNQKLCFENEKMQQVTNHNNPQIADPIKDQDHQFYNQEIIFSKQIEPLKCKIQLNKLQQVQLETSIDNKENMHYSIDSLDTSPQKKVTKKQQIISNQNSFKKQVNIEVSTFQQQNVEQQRCSVAKSRQQIKINSKSQQEMQDLFSFSQIDKNICINQQQQQQKTMDIIEQSQVNIPNQFKNSNNYKDLTIQQRENELTQAKIEEKPKIKPVTLQVCKTEDININPKINIIPQVSSSCQQAQKQIQILKQNNCTTRPDENNVQGNYQPFSTKYSLQKVQQQRSTPVQIQKTNKIQQEIHRKVQTSNQSINSKMATPSQISRNSSVQKICQMKTANKTPNCVENSASSIKAGCNKQNVKSNNANFSSSAVPSEKKTGIENRKSVDRRSNQKNIEIIPSNSCNFIFKPQFFTPLGQDEIQNMLNTINSRHSRDSFNPEFTSMEKVNTVRSQDADYNNLDKILETIQSMRL